MISASFLALKIAYLVKQSGKNRFTLSGDKLKRLAQKEVLTIPYLQKLKYELEELGYFLGVLKSGGYGIFNIISLEGAPSLPLQQQTLDELSRLTEEELQKYCCTQISKELIADSEADKKTLQLDELWRILIKTAKNRLEIDGKDPVISYGSLAVKLTEIFSYKVHHKAVIELLKTIAAFCKKYDYPSLTYIVTHGKTNLPNELANEANGQQQFKEELERVQSFNWDDTTTQFKDFLNRNKEN